MGFITPYASTTPLSGYAPAGLVYITSSTFSAASTVSVNGCFTATYENYRIVYQLATATGTVNLQIRMRAASSDDTSANYAMQYVDGSGSGSAGMARTLTATAGVIGGAGTTGSWGAIEVLRPQIAAATYMTSLVGVSVASPSVTIYSLGHNVSTAYDGFTIYPASSTITGSLAVYGYRKA